MPSRERPRPRGRKEARAGSRLRQTTGLQPHNKERRKRGRRRQVERKVRRRPSTTVLLMPIITLPPLHRLRLLLSRQLPNPSCLHRLRQLLRARTSTSRVAPLTREMRSWRRSPDVVPSRPPFPAVPPRPTMAPAINTSINCHQASLPSPNFQLRRTFIPHRSPHLRRTAPRTAVTATPTEVPAKLPHLSATEATLQVRVSCLRSSFQGRRWSTTAHNHNNHNNNNTTNSNSGRPPTLRLLPAPRLNATCTNNSMATLPHSTTCPKKCSKPTGSRCSTRPSTNWSGTFAILSLNAKRAKEGRVQAGLR